MKTNGENIVVQYIKANHLKKKHIAEKLKMSPQNLDGRLSKSALPTDFIEDLSDAINHHSDISTTDIYLRTKGAYNVEQVRTGFPTI